MNYDEVMAQLEAMGTAQNRKVYGRHGAGENMFGVSFANLKILKKKIKIDHALAVRLWESGNVDAQTLATMTADPGQIDEETVETWLKDLRYYLLVDVLVGGIVSKTPFARSKMEQWTQSDEEWIGRAGWQLMAHLAMKDEELTDDYLEPYLERIEKTIHQGKNRVKDAMNGALIAIGMRSAALEKKALDIAAKIGKVDVDHGETSCKTPDAAAYIKKARKRKKKK
ncbi:MAG: DNA alkylation repair protein [bacterium]|nr:DNA alkylation repair protein [bacterium]